MKNLTARELTRLAFGPDTLVEVGGSVIAIVTPEGGGLTRVYRTRNIITNEGDRYYAQKSVGESPTYAFDTMWLGTSAGSAAPGKASDADDIGYITSSAKAVKSTYPKTNDTGDADNTGDGIDVVTWTFEWTTGDFNNADIGDGQIGVGAHGAGEPVLTHFEFSGGAFAKTASDTLKVIINHTFNGV